jgi:hypothetical protein
MQAQAAFLEAEDQADRLEYQHRCRCCNRVLTDGERSLMVRVGWRKAYAIHDGCGDKQRDKAGWTWRDAFARLGTEYHQGKALSMPAVLRSKQQATA